MQENIEDASNSLLISVFKSEKTIDSQLPIFFKSGYTLEDFHTKCHSCSAHLKGNQFKGSIFQVAKNSRFECWSLDKIDSSSSDSVKLEKIMIDAVGFCPQCSVYTPCQVHVEDKGLSEEEAQAREKIIEAQREERKNKSFFGLKLKNIDPVKSQRTRILNASKLNKIEEAKTIINKDSLNVENTITKNKQENIKSPLQNHIEKALYEEKQNIGKIDENITDINIVSRHNLAEAIKKGGKTLDAYNAIAKAVPMPTQSKDNNIKTNSSNGILIPASPVSQSFQNEPKLNFLNSQNIRLNITNKEILGSFGELSLESQSNIENGKQGSVLFIRGNKDKDLKIELEQEKKIEPYMDDVDKVMNRRDSRGVQGSSTSAAVKIETKKTYIQSSGTVREKIIYFFSNIYSLIKNSKENRKNDILKNYNYKAEKLQGRDSARTRLESLRQNEEFARKSLPKVKAKKHNHDSFH